MERSRIMAEQASVLDAINKLMDVRQIVAREYDAIPHNDINSPEHRLNCLMWDKLSSSIQYLFGEHTKLYYMLYPNDPR